MYADQVAHGLLGVTASGLEDLLCDLDGALERSSAVDTDIENSGEGFLAKDRCLPGYFAHGHSTEFARRRGACHSEARPWPPASSQESAARGGQASGHI